MTVLGALKADIRFFDRVETRSDGCWIWTGAKTEGYGAFWYRMRQQLAHRVLYEAMVGPIAKGMELDHLCRAPACVNPTHLESVTGYENWRRSNAPSANAARSTCCARGHAFDEVNTYIRTKANGRVWRMCRACGRLRAKGYYKSKAQRVP